MKKRLIFTLLYEKGNFVLSRNFRTQKIGDIGWLASHYNFGRVALHIDELVVINVSRDRNYELHFRETLAELSRGVFVPVTAGGGIASVEDADSLFRSGADKIIVNRALHHDPSLLSRLAIKYGKQAIVGSLDISRERGELRALSDKASFVETARTFVEVPGHNQIGEIYLNSIDRDGTGQGMDVSLVEFMGTPIQIPVILAGGAGKPAHLAEAIGAAGVNAVATANLLNFVGEGLSKTRTIIREYGVDLARWES